MIIFVGSKEKGYFCEDVATKIDTTVEYIDTDIHINNQIPEIMKTANTLSLMLNSMQMMRI